MSTSTDTEIVPLAQAPKPSYPGTVPRRSYIWAFIGFLIFVIGPAALAGWYYYTMAADRYVAEFRYSVRIGTGVDQAIKGGGVLTDPSALLAAGDSFILEDYLTSQRAMLDLEKQVDLRAMFDKDGDDPVRNYSPDIPPETLLEYWEAAIDVHFDVVTGISTVKVAMFTPEDARDAANVLVDQLRILVGELSAEAQSKMLDYVAGEVSVSQEVWQGTLDNIRTFRLENSTFSPETTTDQKEQRIGELEQQRTELRIQLDVLPQNSPLRASLNDRLTSLEQQIEFERSKNADRSSESLTEQLNEYNRLEDEREIALQSYVSAQELQRESRAQAALTEVQLVVFVPPSLPTISTAPERWFEVMIVGLIAFALWLVLRIFVASLRTP